MADQFETLGVGIDASAAEAGAARVVRSIAAIQAAALGVQKSTDQAGKAVAAGMDRLATLMQRQLDQQARMGQTAARASAQMAVAQQASTRAMQDMARATQGLDGMLRGLVGRLQQVGAAFGVAFGVRALIQMADASANLEGRLRLVTRSSEELRQVQTRLYAVAQETRSSYQATSELYARLARSTRTLGASQADLLTVTKTINQGFIVSGASAGQAQAALVQLGQAFASGALRGDELNSVMEQAPRLAEAIEKGLGLATGGLRKAAAEGKLTSKAVFDAIKKSADDIQAEYAKMPLTVGQAMTQVQNAVLRFVGVQDGAAGASRGLAERISALARFLDRNGPLVVGIVTTTTALLAMAAAAVAAERGFGLALRAGVAFATFLVTSPWAPIVTALAALGIAMGVNAARAEEARQAVERYRDALNKLSPAQAQGLYVRAQRTRDDAALDVALARRRMNANPNNDAASTAYLEAQGRLAQANREFQEILRVNVALAAQDEAGRKKVTAATTALTDEEKKRLEASTKALAALRLQVAEQERLRAAQTEGADVLARVTAAIEEERAVRAALADAVPAHRAEIEALTVANARLAREQEIVNAAIREAPAAFAAAREEAAKAQAAFNATVGQDARQRTGLRQQLAPFAQTAVGVPLGALVPRARDPLAVSPGVGALVGDATAGLDALLASVRRDSRRLGTDLSRDLSQGLTQGLQQAFSQFLQGGFKSWDAFARSAGDLFARVLSDSVGTALAAAVAPVMQKVADALMKVAPELSVAFAAAGVGYAVGGTTTNRASGALRGAGAGAATGAALGSIVPGVGTGIGALIGGGVGAVSGYLGARDAAKKAAEAAEQARLAEIALAEARRNATLQAAADLSRDLDLRELRALGLDAEADALDRVRATHEAYVKALNAGASPELLARLQRVQELERQRAENARLIEQNRQQASDARETGDFLGGLGVRALRLGGRDRDAVGLEATLRAQADQARAGDLAARGLITPEQLAAITRLLNDEVAKALADYDAALRAQAEALATAQRQFREDLAVRALVAQGRAEEAEVERLRLAQQRETAEALAAGYDTATLAQLAHVQALEAQALATQQAAAAAERAVAAERARAQATTSITAQYLAATGDVQGAERVRLVETQRQRREEAIKAGVSPSTLAQLDVIDKYEMAELARRFAPVLEAIGAASAASGPATPAGIVAGTRGSAFAGSTEAQADRMVGYLALVAERVGEIRDVAVAGRLAFGAALGGTLRVEVDVRGDALTDDQVDQLGDRLVARLGGGAALASRRAGGWTA